MLQMNLKASPKWALFRQNAHRSKLAARPKLQKHFSLSSRIITTQNRTQLKSDTRSKAFKKKKKNVAVILKLQGRCCLTERLTR